MQAVIDSFMYGILCRLHPGLEVTLLINLV